MSEPDHDLDDTVPPRTPEWLENDWDELRTQVEGSCELDRTWTDYCGTHEAQDRDGFLAYLFGRQLITERTFRELNREKQIDLSPTRGSSGSDRFAVLGRIGEGGGGQVHLARDKDLRRKVALKSIPVSRETAGIVIERFVCEAQITAQLEHPNIVPVYGFEEGQANRLVFSMKLVDGQTFEQLIHETRDRYLRDPASCDDEPRRLATRLEHFLKVCDAMSYAHDKGVLHRDLKPANIMLGAFNEVYVMDWGIARLIGAPEDSVEGAVELGHEGAEDALQRTQVGQVIGTPRYMSPEQLAGDNDQLDQRCDLFQLGLILFELVTLKPSFVGETTTDVMACVRAARLQSTTHCAPQVAIPVELEAVIEKATARDRQARYATVAELADDLRRFLRGEAVLARPDTLAQRLSRWVGRHRQLTMMMLLSALLLLAGGVILSLYRERAAARTARRHEARLSGFLTAVARQSQGIDIRFARYESMIGGLSGAATDRLQRGVPWTGKIYDHADFAAADRAPPDLAWSPVYRKKVSVDWPTYKVAPEVAPAQVIPQIRKLFGLRRHFLRMFLASGGVVTRKLDRDAQRRALTERGMPIRWAYIGLARGVMFSYPGKGPYPDEYDPRKRPWYKLALGKVGARWGNPYIDSQGQGLILPCVRPLYDDGGQMLGVAGLEVTFDTIIETMLTLPGVKGVRETYLLDEKGRIVIRSSEAGKQFKGGRLHMNKALTLKPFPSPAVIEDVRARRSGHTTLKSGELVAYYRLQSLGWFFVVRVDRKALLDG